MQKYLILYQTNPEDYSNIQNIGVSYIRLREFAKALPYINKVVDAKALDDGKSQFMLAICYENLKEHDKACENARYALAKNYFPSQTKKLISVNCK